MSIWTALSRPTRRRSTSFATPVAPCSTPPAAHTSFPARSEGSTRSQSRHSLKGEIAYTPSAEEAIASVDRGEAGAALLLRPPTVAQVREVARRGETMPQKSTYFYPKLPSGLLFLPL